jgi:hypothetical protein
MTYSKILGGALFAAALTLAGAANAQIKIALDSPPDLEGSGSYVWAHTFSTYLNEHGMPAEEFARGSIGGRRRTVRPGQPGPAGSLDVAAQHCRFTRQADLRLAPALLLRRC